MEPIDDELQRIRERKMREMMNPRVSPAPAAPIAVTDADFDGAIKRNGLVVVDCWAAWCGPCKMLGPIFDRLARRFAGEVTFLKLDTDRNPRTAARLAIMSIPTILFFKDGAPVERLVGVQPEQVLESVIRRYL